MSIPWVEKYRPTEFKDIVGIEEEYYNKIISSVNDMPNLLFFGKQGTGKTTLAKVLINKLAPIDCLRINGSDTTGVDTIREKVFNFVTSKGSIDDKPKIVWVEEADFFSQSAFAALRGLIEQYMKNSRYIFTANYINKIPEPIQSRFSCVEFKKHSQLKILARIKYICEQEKVNIEDSVLIDLVKSHNGDIRAIINTLQKLSSSGEITKEKIINRRSVINVIYNYLVTGDWSSIRLEIPSLVTDYNTVLVELDELFFNSELPLSKKADINDIIAQGQVDMNFSFDKDIAFSAISSRIIRALKRQQE